MINMKKLSLDRHCNKFHSLEGKSGLDDDGENGEESVCADIFHQLGPVEGARVIPILRPSS